jgi:hypothetical protein
MPPVEDAYHFPGVDRDIIKAWVTMTLGHDRFHKRWPKSQKERFGDSLQRNYPIRDIRSLILDRFPLLKDWENSKIRWGELQYMEGQIILETILRLKGNWAAPALPVFDSIIIPKSKKGIAKTILNRCFMNRLGVYPSLKEKGLI